MTVTAIAARERAATPNSDEGRLRLTAGRLIGRAHRLVDQYGHDREGFGSPATGFGLAGAVYAGAGFYAGRHDLIDPRVCAAHRKSKRDRRPAAVCEATCEHPLWTQCNLAFTYLATALRTPQTESLYLDGLLPQPRDYAQVCEADELLDTAAAMRLLGRVLWALNLPPVRVARPARTLAGAA